MKKLSVLILSLVLAFPVVAMASGISSPAFPYSAGNPIPFSFLTGVQAPETSAAGYGILNGANIDLWGTKTVPAGTPADTSSVQVFTNKILTSPVINGGSQTLAQVDAHTAVSSGSVATINSTPTAQGSNYTAGDLLYVTTGSGDAIVKCATVTSTACTSVTLVDSGSSGYAIGTGQATSKDSCTISGCTGLQVNVTAVGLTPAQVSNTYIYQTGQGSTSIVANYLPTAKAGYGFMAYCGTAVSGYAWSLLNNSGILNGASGDLMYYNGVAGTAGPTHGISIASPTVAAAFVCATIMTNVSGVYSWACTSSVGAWAAY